MIEKSSVFPKKESVTAMKEASGLRTFKACRTCRRQKMRCEGKEFAPCRRCRVAKVECIFDVVTEKCRPVEQRKRPRLVRYTVLSFVLTISLIIALHIVLYFPSGIGHMNSLRLLKEKPPTQNYEPPGRRLSTERLWLHDSSGHETIAHAADLKILNLRDLNAPVSAVYAMTTSTSSASPLSMQPSASARQPESNPIHYLSSPVCHAKPDLIARGLVSMEQARNLFDR
jgi:hypothetical protein